MIQFFLEGGSFMWVLLIIAIVIIILTITNGVQLYSDKEKNKVKLENGINSILFWGGFSLVLGFFAHFLGIYKAMLAIRSAGDISPAIVAAGYAMSTITILSGLFILMLSSIIWFVLKNKLAQLES
jgi:hypothetical protein